MPGKCRKISRLMNMYIDGMLSEREKKAFLGHITACGSCRDEFNNLKYMVSLAGEINDSDPPVFLKEAVMRKVRAIEFDKQKKPGIYSNRKVWAAASVVAGCAAVFVFIYITGIGNLLPGGFGYKGTESADGLRAASADRSAGVMETEDCTIAGTLKENGTELTDQEADSYDTAGLHYNYEIRIAAEDPETVKNDINAIIDAVFEGTRDLTVPVSGNEIIIEATPEQGEALISRIREKFSKVHISENSSEGLLMIRIVIE